MKATFGRWTRLTTASAIVAAGAWAGGGASPATAADPEPSVDLEKFVSVDDGATWHDADNPTGPTVIAGSNTVHFKYVVTNTGDAILTNLTVTDDKIDLDLSSVPSSLAVGQGIEIVSGPHRAESGQHTNTAKASATTDGQQIPVLPPDDGNDYQFVFSFENGAVASGTWDGSNTIDLADFSDDIDPGDLSSGVHISCSDHFGFEDPDDDNPDGWGEKDAPNIDDDPGWRLAGVQIRKQGDICTDGGVLTPPITDTDTANYFGEDVDPDIDIEKYVQVNDGDWHDADDPTGPQALVGVDEVSFRFVVTNTGGSDLTNLDIYELANTDDNYTLNFGPALAAAPVPFLIGDSFEFELGPFDAEAGQHHNEVKVEATEVAPPPFNPQWWSDQYPDLEKGVFRFLLADGTIIEGISDKNEVEVPSDTHEWHTEVTPHQTFSTTFHISCSDDFGFGNSEPDGWGEKGAPVQGVDNGPIVAYAIYKSDKNPVEFKCGFGDVDPDPETVTDQDPAHYLGVEPAAIGDRVWFDTDGDGIQSAGEPGINDVTVELLDESGAKIADTVTADLSGEPGYYRFENLWPGTYSVRFVLDGAQVFTLPSVGADASDSDADPSTGETAQTVLDPGETDLTWDAGVVEPGVAMVKCVGDDTVASSGVNSLSCDTFGADANDSDGADVPVFAPGDTVTFTYVIENIGSLSVPAADVVLTDDVLGPIAGPAANGDGDALFEPGEVWVYQTTSSALDLDDPANVGVVVSGCESNPGATDPSRNTYKNIGTVEIPGDSDSDPAHYCNPAPAAIGDRVWFDTDEDGIQDPGEPGVNGVTVELLDDGGNVVDSTTTANHPVSGEPGYYLFGDLPAGDYSVRFVLGDDQVFTLQDQGDDASDSDADPVTGETVVTELVAGETDLTWDAGVVAAPAAIGDRAWFDTDEDGIQDPGEPGVNGVTVELLDATGNVVDTTTTANHPVSGEPGYYLFDDLDAGTYSVRFVIGDDQAFTTPNQGDDASDSDANPATGQTIVTVLDPGETDLTWDAGVVPALAAIGDRVWFDTNEDGIQDDGEPGLNQIVVLLLDANGDSIDSTLTGNHPVSGDPGYYLFDELPAGEYSIRFVLGDDQVFTLQDQGDDATDSDADPVTGETVLTELVAGETDLTWDAGVVPAPAAIGDRVWNDLDGDGIQDPGEPGVNGVTVELLDDGGNVVDSTTTANHPVSGEAGYYLFDDLDAGEYAVRFVVDASQSFTLPSQGGDASDSDADPATGETGPIIVSAGQTDLTWDAGLAAPAVEMLKCVGDDTITLAGASSLSCDAFGADADDADGADVPVVVPGATVTFTYVIENTGSLSVPAADVVLTDDVLGAIAGPAHDGDGDALFEPGEFWVYQTTSTVRDLGDPANANAVVLGCTNNPDDGDPQRNAYKNIGMVTIPGDSDSDPAHYCNPAPSIDIEKSTNGFDADDANGADVPVIAPGATVTWTYVVTNTGDVSVPAADVTVTDSVVGVDPVFDPASDDNADGVLSPGEQWTYTATGAAGDLGDPANANAVVSGCSNHPDDGDPQRNAYENIGMVTIPGDSDSDPSHYCNPTPSIEIEKSTNGADADNANGADVPVITPGATVTWTYVVTNTGDVTILAADVTVTDSIAGVNPVLDPSSDDGNDDVLSPGEQWTYTATGTAGDLGDPANANAVVLGCSNHPDDGDPQRNTYENIGMVTIPGDSDSDPSHYCNPKPSIDIEKSTNGADADNANGADVPVITPGATVTWTYVVTNTGDVTIPAADVTVTDSIAGVNPTFIPSSDAGNDDLLSPGEKWTYTATGTAIGADSVTPGQGIVMGCSSNPNNGAPERNTYENIGTVAIPGDSDTDPSHYCLPLGEIGDRAWYDQNGDGIQDPGEPSLPGVDVSLYRVSLLDDPTAGTPDGVLVATTVTNADGRYRFSNLAPGEYFVKFEGVDLYPTTTLRNIGTNDSLDSDPNRVTGATEVFRLDRGESTLIWDAGFYDEPTEQVADLKIVKTSSTDLLGVDDTATFTLEVTNDGTDSATNVVVSDLVPDAFVVTAASSDDLLCRRDGNEITCETELMAAGESATVTVTVALAADADVGEVCNVGTVTSDTSDPNLGNNSAEACLDVASQAPPVTNAPPPVTLPETGSGAARDVTMIGAVLFLLGGALRFGVRRRVKAAPPAA